MKYATTFLIDQYCFLSVKADYWIAFIPPLKSTVKSLIIFWRLKPPDLIEQFNSPCCLVTSLKTLRFQDHSNSQIEKSCLQDMSPLNRTNHDTQLRTLCYVRLHLEILPNAHHIASTHKLNMHSTVHSNQSTSTSYSTWPLKKARPFKSHSVGHLHIYSSLHTDAHQGLVGLAFPPQDPSSIIKKHGGFPLMAPLQQNAIKRTTQGRGRKCQTCFIQLWKYERRCDLKDERGVHEVRGQSPSFLQRYIESEKERYKRGNSKPTQQKEIKFFAQNE